ncbi:MAG: tail fiber protein [Vicinamibacterales bacterium]
MPLDPFVGQILWLPFTFPPRGYAFCQGQLLPISQNTALFSLLGTTYGGNGQTTFALPNLQGAAPVGFGQGPGLSDYVQGETGGSETVALSLAQMPSHTHPVGAAAGSIACKNGRGNQQTPAGNVPAIESTGVTATYGSAPTAATMQAGSVALGGTAAAAVSGAGQGHENMQPYLTLNYCIALQGVFPPRS